MVGAAVAVTASIVMVYHVKQDLQVGAGATVWGSAKGGAQPRVGLSMHGAPQKGAAQLVLAVLCCRQMPALAVHPMIAAVLL